MEVLIRDAPIEINQLIFDHLSSILDPNVLIANSVIIGSFVTYLLSRTMYYNGTIIDFDDIDIVVNNIDSLYLILSTIKPDVNFKIFKGSRYGCNTFNIVTGELTIQFVLREFDDPASILNSLDFDYCQFIIAGYGCIPRLIYTNWAEIAMQTRVISYCRILYEHRIIKTIKKGFKGIPLSPITSKNFNVDLVEMDDFTFLENIHFFNYIGGKQWYPISDFAIENLTLDPRIYKITDDIVDQTKAIMIHGMPPEIFNKNKSLPYQCYFKSYNLSDNIVRCDNTEFLLCVLFRNGSVVHNDSYNDCEIKVIKSSKITILNGFYGCYCNLFMINNKKYLIVKITDSSFIIDKSDHSLRKLVLPK